MQRKLLTNGKVHKRTDVRWCGVVYGIWMSKATAKGNPFQE